MAIGADHQLTRLGDVLDDDVVADAFASDQLAVALHFAVELDALLLGEGLLYSGERRSLFTQAHLDVGFGHDAVEKRQVVAERKHRRRVRDRRILAQAHAEQRLRHRRDILVAEPDIRAHEQRVARLHRGDTELARLGVGDRSLRDDLLAQRHRARRSRHCRRHGAAGPARLVVSEQTAVSDDLGGDRVEAFGELLDRDRLTADESRDQREIRRRQQADVLAVLAIDLLDVPGDDNLHARLEFAVGRSLTRTTAAFRHPADDQAEAAVLDCIDLDVAATQTDEAVARQRLVVVVADPSRRELVGADVVDQLLPLVERHVELVVELSLQRALILGQVENAARELDTSALLRGRHRGLRCAPGSSQCPGHRQCTQTRSRATCRTARVRGPTSAGAAYPLPRAGDRAQWRHR